MQSFYLHFPVFPLVLMIVTFLHLHFWGFIRLPMSFYNLNAYLLGIEFLFLIYFLICYYADNFEVRLFQDFYLIITPSLLVITNR